MLQNLHYCKIYMPIGLYLSFIIFISYNYIIQKIFCICQIYLLIIFFVIFIIPNAVNVSIAPTIQIHSIIIITISLITSLKLIFHLNEYKQYITIEHVLFYQKETFLLIQRLLAIHYPDFYEL